jgi:hypothetical protein
LHGLATKGQLAASPDRSQTKAGTAGAADTHQKGRHHADYEFQGLYIAELQQMSLEGRPGEPFVERGERVVRSCR